MAIRTLNSNLPSLGAQRQLSRITSELERSYQRLSSGLRINRASDDAAGLSVAKSIEADTRVYTQGVRNLNDAISYLDIADGAVGSLKTILFRARELATQAANGTLGDTQRGALNKELVELSKEYNRIIQTTEFNGSKIFESQGTTPTTIQFGYGSNESINLETGAGPLTSDIARVNVTNTGAQANNDSGSNGISGDGRFVVFTSAATNLVSGDTNAQPDVFVRDRLLNTTHRVSVSSSGGQAGGASFGASISFDGRYVTYTSAATDLVSGDTNGVNDIFLHDLYTGTTELISVGPGGAQGNAASTASSVSADGRYVSFESSSSNLVSNDSNAVGDIFVRDRLTNTTQRVSVSSTGAQYASASTSAKISGDGKSVIYTAGSPVDAADGNGAQDVAVWRRSSGTSTRVSVSSSGATAGSGATNGAINFDGTIVAFESTSTNLVSNDTNGASDVFSRNLLTGETIRASLADDESQSNGGSTNASISADGRFVTFISAATNLGTTDTNGAQDPFVRDMASDLTTMIDVSASGVQSNAQSLGVSISGDGQFIAFHSDGNNLVPSDTNSGPDVFTVRNTSISRAVGFTSIITPFVGVGIVGAKQAQMSQSTIDLYLRELNVSVGKLGATTSRAYTASSVIQNRVDNLTTAASRIMDADIAEEASTLSAKQVLQQSAQKVLALANEDLKLVKGFLGLA